MQLAIIFVVVDISVDFQNSNFESLQNSNFESLQNSNFESLQNKQLQILLWIFGNCFVVSSLMT